MKDIVVLLAHLLTTIAKLLGPGGAKAVLAENVLLKQQLLLVTRSRRRGPHLGAMDRLVLGLCTLFLPRRRVEKVAVAIRPSTLLSLRQSLIRRKYRALLSPKRRTKPGPKGPCEPLIRIIVELKSRNPRFGCPGIAMIISRTFGEDIDKDVVRRVLDKHYRPGLDGSGPSWRVFLAHLIDSLWSVVQCRCESALQKGCCALVVMEQFTDQIIELGVRVGNVARAIFNRAIAPIAHLLQKTLDQWLGVKLDRWHENAYISEVGEIAPLPYWPRSPPFIDGFIHRPYRDRDACALSRSAHGLHGAWKSRGSRVLAIDGSDIFETTRGTSARRRVDQAEKRVQIHCRRRHKALLAA